MIFVFFREIKTKLSADETSAGITSYNRLQQVASFIAVPQRYNWLTKVL
jgi:hypothetical protein